MDGSPPDRSKLLGSEDIIFPTGTIFRVYQGAQNLGVRCESQFSGAKNRGGYNRGTLGPGSVIKGDGFGPVDSIEGIRSHINRRDSHARTKKSI